ncbi:MAG: type 1 glutamine amidotransferase [Rhizobiales bacterium]|nr:type 1 glutamine amidotransferase [Hyphomicrobiales bacterium]
MRVLVVENYRSTPLGQVGTALSEAGVAVDFREAHRGAPLPATATEHDGLVVLGGEQNALADEACPWFPELLPLIRGFGDADKPVLGICLGAQLVARAYGADNILGRPVEFGWHAVRPTEAGRSDPVLAGLGAGSPIFHWHEDTFSLPEGAAHLALSDMTANQAFRLGRATYGIQFHFEADRALVEGWNRDFADSIRDNDPDWAERYPAEAARHGPAADATGLELARRWARLVRAG